MSLTGEQLAALRAESRAFINAVGREDATALQQISLGVSDRFRVDGGFALAVVLAEEVLRGRERLAASQEQATQFAEAFMDQKRRVKELREMFDARDRLVAA